MNPPCVECGKEMIPEEDFPDERWSCECGVTAREVLKVQVAGLFREGGLEEVAERGKRVITKPPFVPNWDEDEWLIYEEPIE